MNCECFSLERVGTGITVSLLPCPRIIAFSIAWNLCMFLPFLPSVLMMAVPFSTDEYYARLQLDSQTLDAAPTLKKLQAIQEAHLARIPFENTAQHGVVGGPASLDMAATAQKILRNGRGGFCFELNGLLSVFLEQLGYRSVIRVPAYVYTENDVEMQGYRPEPTHMILIVETLNDTTGVSGKYLVDVGFGEPPLHPLRYDLLLGEEQVTPEGMCSKIVAGKDDVVRLYWKQSGEWVERLRWSYQHSMLKANQGPRLCEFSKYLRLVQDPGSIFSQKLIVCRLTRDEKVVLAGSRLQITGPPRFSGEPPSRSIRCLESEIQAREVLRDLFSQPWTSTKGLKLTKSKAADPAVWSNM